MPSGEYEKEFDYLQKMEDESDQVEVEIADYLTKVQEVCGFETTLQDEVDEAKN